MSYVLVSLIREGDEGTEESDAFARWYEARHAPSVSFHAESPNHEEVAAAVLALPKRRGFVLGHGGDTLRAVPGPGVLNVFEVPVVWANVEQLAAMFDGARVYVFACSTLAEANDGESFGRAAVARGVAAYAGHRKPIQAPNVGSDAHLDKKLRRGVERVVTTFLDGCNDVKTLLMEARSAMSERAGLRLGTRPAIDGWPLDWQRIFGSLGVELPKGPAPRDDL